MNYYGMGAPRNSMQSRCDRSKFWWGEREVLAPGNSTNVDQEESRNTKSSNPIRDGGTTQDAKPTGNGI